jgi:hypothetical protein
MWGAGKMTKEEVEGVGFEFCDCAEMMKVGPCLRQRRRCSLFGSVCLIRHRGATTARRRRSRDILLQKYDKDVLVDGMNTLQGELAR